MWRSSSSRSRERRPAADPPRAVGGGRRRRAGAGRAQLRRQTAATRPTPRRPVSAPAGGGVRGGPDRPGDGSQAHRYRAHVRPGGADANSGCRGTRRHTASTPAAGRHSGGRGPSVVDPTDRGTVRRHTATAPTADTAACQANSGCRDTRRHTAGTPAAGRHADGDGPGPAAAPPLRGPVRAPVVARLPPGARALGQDGVAAEVGWGGQEAWVWGPWWISTSPESPKVRRQVSAR